MLGRRDPAEPGLKLVPARRILVQQRRQLAPGFREPPGPSRPWTSSSLASRFRGLRRTARIDDSIAASHACARELDQGEHLVRTGLLPAS